MKNPFADFWARMPEGFVRTFVARFVLLFVFAASVILIWWNVAGIPWLDNGLESWGVYRLQRMETLRQQESAKQAQLLDETSKMESRWNRSEAEQVGAKFKQAQEQLFAGNEEFLRWQEELKRQTNQFSLEVKAQSSRTQACPLPNKVFTIIPATIEMRVSDELLTQAPYKRVLDLAKNLTTQKKRVDLLELSVKGNSNSVSQAKFELQLWSEENSRTP